MTTDENTQKKIQALKSFSVLIEQFSQKYLEIPTITTDPYTQKVTSVVLPDRNIVLHPDEIKYQMRFLKRYLDQCIEEIENNFSPMKLECLNQTYSIIFENHDNETIENYLKYAENLNAGNTKKNIGMLMVGLGLAIVVLTASVAVVMSPFLGLGIGAVAALATSLSVLTAIAVIAAGVAGSLLNKKYPNQAKLSLGMSIFADYRFTMFGPKNQHRIGGHDRFDNSLKEFCRKNPNLKEELQLKEQDEFDQFFEQPIFV